MFLPISFLNRHLRLFRAPICPDHRSYARSCAAGTETALWAQLSADPLLSHWDTPEPSLNVQQTPSDSSAFCLLHLPFPEPSLLPSYGHCPFVITCNSHKPCGFYALGQASSSSASLASHPPHTNQRFPSGVWDVDACLTSVLSISKPLVRAWTVAIRI